MAPDPIPKPDTGDPKRKLFVFILAVGILLVLAAAWSWGPLKPLLNVERIVAHLREAGAHHGLLAAIGIFALASAVGVPLVFLAIVSLVAFGALFGTLTTLVGASFGSACSFLLGRKLGTDVLLHYGGQRLLGISRRLGQSGIAAAAALRLVPVAPFAVVNMVAGTSHIRLHHFLLGSALGMLPGTLILAFFVDSLTSAIENPGPASLWLIGVTLALIVVGTLLARKWLAKR